MRGAVLLVLSHPYEGATAVVHFTSENTGTERFSYLPKITHSEAATPGLDADTGARDRWAGEGVSAQARGVGLWWLREARSGWRLC